MSCQRHAGPEAEQVPTGVTFWRLGSSLHFRIERKVVLEIISDGEEGSVERVGAAKRQKRTKVAVRGRTRTFQDALTIN